MVYIFGGMLLEKSGNILRKKGCPIIQGNLFES